MNREIEFRGFCEGYNNNKCFEISVLALKECSWNCDKGIGVSIPYQPHIKIMQYTGLKDKNGKKIFEGDKVKINNINYRVLYSEYRLSFVFLRLKEATCYFSLDEIYEDYYKENKFALLDIEVIGNIYEDNLESEVN